MLVSKTPIPRDVPHEKDAWFHFVQLSWTKLRDARKAAEREGRATMKELGAEFIKALNSDDGVEKARKLLDEQQWDPRAFDANTLLGFGVIAWSYEAEVNAETVGELDEATKDWAVRTIIEIARPPTEAEEKNGSPSSSAH